MFFDLLKIIILYCVKKVVNVICFFLFNWICWIYYLKSEIRFWVYFIVNDMKRFG